jgi:hypothetical protein
MTQQIDSIDQDVAQFRILHHPWVTALTDDDYDCGLAFTERLQFSLLSLRLLLEPRHSLECPRCFWWSIARHLQSKLRPWIWDTQVAFSGNRYSSLNCDNLLTRIECTSTISNPSKAFNHWCFIPPRQRPHQFIAMDSLRTASPIEGRKWQQILPSGFVSPQRRSFLAEETQFKTNQKARES